MPLYLIYAFKLYVGLSNGGVCINDHLQISANNMNGKQQQKVQSGVTDTGREAGM